MQQNHRHHCVDNTKIKLEASLPVLPSLVPLAHFTLVALLLLLPHGAFVSPVSPVSFSVSFLESRIASFLSTRNTLLCTAALSLLARLRIFAHILANALPCRGLVKKSPSISLVVQYVIFISPFFLLSVTK